MRKFLKLFFISAAMALFFQPVINSQPEVKSDTESAKVPPVAVPVIVNGEAQRIAEFEDPQKWIRHDLWVETEFDTDGDGRNDRMHVDVTRPALTEDGNLKLPVVYESSPYFAGTGSDSAQYFWNVRQELDADPSERAKMPPIQRRGKRPVISNSQTRAWVPYGFIVVHSSAPGTGLSQGCPTVGTRIEALAPKAVIDWLNGRAKGFTTPDGNEEVKAFWSTGRVGMIGTSYNGTIPFAAATTGVKGLEAIIPVSPNNSYYHYYRSNGLVRSPGGYLGEDVDVLYDFIHSNPDNCEYCDSVYKRSVMQARHDRRSGDYNEFWAERDLMNYVDDFRAATLMAHGFNDWNVMISHSARFIDVLKKQGVPLQIYFHQGGHGGEPPFEMMNRWFTRYLFGVENDVEKEPKAWIVREKDDRLKPTPYADYPNPGASPVKFFLSPGAPQAGSLVMNKPSGPGYETLTDNFSFSGSTLAKAEWTDHRLIYLTPPLKEDLHISGVTSIKIKALSSKSAANLSVWLVTLPWIESRNPKPTDNIITRGWADLRNHRSLTESEPLQVGRFYEMTFDLEPDDQVIPAGKQIGLLIFSSDREYTLWPDPGTKLTVDLSGTEITLPVVGGIGGVRFE
ncbi:MAG: Xaa-Pro dipeptidyl-peptidase [Bacteroidales bacterium]|jgi:X-Pro dipeptidyl-peptidase|nr:Xaa-Pro dipeptidyl-peptidase [Bacteroidales bacterium]